MTVCVAALCDKGKGLVLASDKMIGSASIEAELDIEKTFQVHQKWRVMFAGNDITPVSDILRWTKARLPTSDVSLQQIVEETVRSYREKRLRNAEALFLSPLNLTFSQFVDDGERYRKIFGRDTYIRLLTNIHEHELEIELLVAGFDEQGNARMFSIDSDEGRGVPQHHDEIPGFHAIGSGGTAANHMMYYRQMSTRLPARLAALLAFEAKYFGEQASGVGTRTDLYVWRSGEDPKRLDEIFIEDVLVKKFIKRLQPPDITRKHLEDLNRVDGFGDLPKSPIPKKDKKADEYKDLITRIGEDE
jgi:20S proteasome alpha/beta subunit